MSDADVELILKEPKSVEEAVPEKPAKTNICNGCELKHGGQCPLDGYKPPKTECDMFLPEISYNWSYGQCPYCGGLTAHHDYLSDELGVWTVGVLNAENNLRHEAHLFCAIQDVIKTKRLKGPCDSCQSNCGVPGIIRSRKDLVLTVEECKEQDTLPIKLSEVNRKALARHRQLVKEFRKRKATEQAAGRSN